MVLVPIFESPEDPNAGLWAVKYEGDRIDIYRQMMTQWGDAEYMFNFCVDHFPEVQRAFGYAIGLEEAADELMSERDYIQRSLLNASLRPEAAGNLQSVFKPLDNRAMHLTVLQPSKTSAKTWKRKEPKLRLYALRIAPGTFVVTGGAIKLVHQMHDHELTREQLLKLTLVKNWLTREGVYYPEDLNELR